MVTSYLIPESDQSGLNGNIDPASLKGKSMEELLKMKKEKEAAIEQDKKLVLENNVPAKAKARRERFLRFDVEDLAYINTEIESRKKTAPAPAKSPVAPPATKPIVPTPVAPPAINPIVPAPVATPATKPIVPAPVATPATKPIVPAPVAPPATKPIVPAPVAPPATKPIVPAPVAPPATKNEEEPKTGFFTPTNILLVLLVVGGGFFFLTRKEK